MAEYLQANKIPNGVYALKIMGIFSNSTENENKMLGLDTPIISESGNRVLYIKLQDKIDTKTLIPQLLNSIKTVGSRNIPMHKLSALLLEIMVELNIQRLVIDNSKLLKNQKTFDWLEYISSALSIDIVFLTSQLGNKDSNKIPLFRRSYLEIIK